MPVMDHCLWQQKPEEITTHLQRRCVFWFSIYTPCVSEGLLYWNSFGFHAKLKALFWAGFLSGCMKMTPGTGEIAPAPGWISQPGCNMTGCNAGEIQPWEIPLTNDVWLKPQCNVKADIMNGSLTLKILLILIGTTNAQHLTGLSSRAILNTAFPSQVLIFLKKFWDPNTQKSTLKNICVFLTLTT